jgi:immune inhibitor A
MKLKALYLCAFATLFAVASAHAIDTSGLPDTHPGSKSDNAEHPLGKKQADLRKQALHKVIKGQAQGKGKNKVVQVAKGQFVELARQGEDSIFTIVGQFGPLDSPFTVLKSGIPGPVRNSIPQPDRSVDNTTIWAPDFNQAYYTNLLFSGAPDAVSMRNFYIEQSSNRYTVSVDVTDWEQVHYKAAHYGRNYCGSIVCQQTWQFVRDAANAWYNAQIASGKTQSQINAYLSKFDVWDRYDYNGNGNFNEPDGYIDHFQIIHAGEGEETGGGAQGSDAIWSHRWYAFYNANGPDGTGPHGLGGVRIGQSNYWIGDYTVEPENGGVGVFAHEFGHDLGLPDLYDTSGNVGGADNSTGFWTLYSSGSYGSTGIPAEGLGSKPVSMSALEKIQLDWSNYELVQTGQQASLKLGPATANTKQAQQLVVLLPDKHVATDVGAPYAGALQYYSGAGNNLDNTMTRAFTLPAAATITAKVRYDIELDWDYAYLTVDGSPVATNLSTNTSPNGQNFGNGITGTSAGWVDLTANLPAGTHTIGFRYWTDPATAGRGFFVDNIAISGQAIDGAETEPGWTYSGFARVGSSVDNAYFNAYFAEYRTYRGYDESLRTGPYHFGFPNTKPNWVQHYPYQDGLLIWYYDTSFPDNNIGDACAAGRCGGLYLPVDAHPTLMIRPDTGKVWRPTYQSWDSTFGLDPTDKICLTASDTFNACYGPQAAVPLFNDMLDWWVPPNPAINHFGWSGVNVPKTGTTIRVVSVSAQGNFMQVHVNK